MVQTDLHGQPLRRSPAKIRAAHKLQGAFKIVLALALQNVIDQNDYPEEHVRQMEAYNMIHDFALNIIHK